MLPVAPGLFSTMTACPQLSESFWPTARARMSEVPPGGYGTMILIGFVGHACAATTVETSAPAIASNERRHAFMGSSLVDFRLGRRRPAFEKIEVASLVGLRHVLEVE